MKPHCQICMASPHHHQQCNFVFDNKSDFDNVAMKQQ